LPKNNEGFHETIVIFVKAPEPGLVKTRLARSPYITESDAAKIAEGMLRDTIILSANSGIDSICVGFFPSDKEDYFRAIIDSLRDLINKSINFHLFPQSGNDFDERFESIVKKVLNYGFDQMVILGADLPYMDPKLINLAFSELSAKDCVRKIVIGPAREGGIYLVGITEDFDPEWFTKYNLFRGGIELSQFGMLCKENNIDIALLPPLTDIDIEEDLVSMISFIEVMSYSSNLAHYHFPYFTSHVLKKLKLSVEQLPGETRKRYLKRGNN